MEWVLIKLSLMNEAKYLETKPRQLKTALFGSLGFQLGPQGSLGTQLEHSNKQEAAI